MKSSLFKLSLLVAILLAMSFVITGCDEDEDIIRPVVLPETITEFDVVFGWTSAIDENCQDVFDFELTAGAVVNFSATEVTGGSVLQMALYGPDVALGGINLFTGSADELHCGYVDGCTNNTGGQTVDAFTIPADGVYRLALTRNYGESCGLEGNYRLQVTSDVAFAEPVQSVDDVASLATTWSCPGGTILSYDEEYGWSSNIGESAQDVFDISFSAGTIVDFSATEVTGNSVLQMALYAPDVALGGMNLFTASDAELNCNYVSGCDNNTGGQVVSDFAIPTAGIYRLAITRNYGQSCGTDGTYRLQITADVGFAEPDQTVDDVASLASEWECPGEGILEFDGVYGWVSPVGENTQDVFDFEFTAGAVLDFSATEVTGGSVLQMALYAPDVALGGTNIFTDSGDELLCNYVANCSENTGGQTYNGFLVPADGTYRLAITRNYGSSCGGEGTYRLQVASDIVFPEPTQTVEDEESLATGTGCPAEVVVEHDAVYDWSCGISEDCQDVFDVEFAAGATVTIAATEVTGDSVLQMALYAPGTSLGGTNLFTSSEAELRCNYVSGCLNNSGGQTVADFNIVDGGTYRLAITRDFGSSCGTSGGYRLHITSDEALGTITQSVDDVASLATDWDCPGETVLSHDQVYGLSSGIGEDVQDVFDFYFSAGDVVDFSATETTDGSVIQIALYAPGVALGGTNLFTETTAELLCGYTPGCNDNTAGQTVNGFVIATEGTYRLAVTRNYGSSCGTTGTYRLQVACDTGFPRPTQSVDDEISLASGTACPEEEAMEHDQVYGWACDTFDSCQDVFDVEFTAGTVVTFAATEVTGDSTLQMALYAPGVSLGGVNLFTSTTGELLCNYVSGCSQNPDGQTVTEYTIVGGGTYRLAITRDWGTSCGSSGDYRLHITADQAIAVTQTVEDVDSLASGTDCPADAFLEHDQVYGWECDTLDSCQDVFDVSFAAGTVVTLAATEVTGDSTLQMALYAPGTSLGGANLLTSTVDELRCNYVSGCNMNPGGQTVSDFTIVDAGVYRLAITRDWGTSCGGSGTYRLHLTADQGMLSISQSVEDVNSIATTWTCPGD